jgi:hypothetical protein
MIHCNYNLIKNQRKVSRIGSRFVFKFQLKLVDLLLFKIASVRRMPKGTTYGKCV